MKTKLLTLVAFVSIVLFYSCGGNTNANTNRSNSNEVSRVENTDWKLSMQSRLT